jgi:hypothetical protein
MQQHWHLANFSICTAEYVRQASSLASTAYDKVLKDAATQLQLGESDA